MQLPSREDWQESLIRKEHDISTYVDVSELLEGLVSVFVLEGFNLQESLSLTNVACATE